MWGGGKKSGAVRCGLVPGGECIQAVAVNGKCKRQVWNKWGGEGCGEVQGGCEEVWRRVYAGDRSQRGAPGAGVKQMGCEEVRGGVQRCGLGVELSAYSRLQSTGRARGRGGC